MNEKKVPWNIRPTPRAQIRPELLQPVIFDALSVGFNDFRYHGERRDAGVGPNSGVAGKARSLLTRLISLADATELAGSVEDQFGSPLRCISFGFDGGNRVGFAILPFGPNHSFGPTGYPIEIQVFDPDCEWVRTLVSNAEIEREVDELFDEAFRLDQGPGEEKGKMSCHLGNGGTKVSSYR